MSNELKEVHERVERLWPLLHSAMQSLMALEAIADFEDPTKHDRYVAREHRNLVGAYSGFFSTLTESLMLNTHIQLAKILIDNEESLHLKKILRYLQAKDKKIQRASRKPDFNESIETFGLWYVSLTPEELNEIATRLEVHTWLIEKLKLVRDKNLAHENLRVTPAQRLTLQELRQLVELSQSILDRVAFTYGGRDDDRYKLEVARTDSDQLLEKLYSTYGRV